MSISFKQLSLRRRYQIQALITNKNGKEMVTMGKFKRHFDGKLSLFLLEQSNSRTENLNGRIQIVRSIGRDYSMFKNFRTIRLFFLTSIDLLPTK